MAKRKMALHPLFAVECRFSRPKNCGTYKQICSSGQPKMPPQPRSKNQNRSDHTFRLLSWHHPIWERFVLVHQEYRNECFRSKGKNSQNGQPSPYPHIAFGTQHFWQHKKLRRGKVKVDALHKRYRCGERQCNRTKNCHPIPADEERIPISHTLPVPHPHDDEAKIDKKEQKFKAVSSKA